MKFAPSRHLFAATAFLATAAAAHAHPGHEGHELTWDLSHLAHHPIATMGCAAVVGAAAAVLLQAMRRRTELKTQSLRVSQRSRGK